MEFSFLINKQIISLYTIIINHKTLWKLLRVNSINLYYLTVLFNFLMSSQLIGEKISIILLKINVKWTNYR